MDDQEITTEQLYQAAVGKGRGVSYIAKFLKFENSDSRRSWNWAALLFGPFWFLYRRMFVVALVVEILAPALFYWLCDIAIGYVFRASPESWLWSVPAIAFQWVLIPVYANYLYFSSVQKRIDRLRQKLQDDRAVLETLEGANPTSILACFVGPLLVAGTIVVGNYFQSNGEGESQIADVLTGLSEAQSAVVKSYIANHVWPERAAALDLSGSHTPYIDVLTIDQGTISVRFGNQASPSIAGRLISLRPSLSGTGAILWACGYASQKGKDSTAGPSGVNLTNVDRRYLPSKCR